MAGLSWNNPNYACHEAVCPVCGEGESYGSGNYSVEVRAYYSGGPAESISRPIQDLRIKCKGDCTVGTGDVSGLYLIQHGRLVNWSADRTRGYLQRMGSPLAGWV